MKKLGKLTISPEKIMKNEELINLQGGYSGSCAWFTCNCNGHYFAGCFTTEELIDLISTCGHGSGCNAYSWP
jgi:hypothetical protein